MKVVVFGAGGAGGYFGARWAEAGLDVTLVARGNHLREIQAEGIRIQSPLGDACVKLRAVSQPTKIERADVCVVATKAWQLPSALATLAPALNPSTLVFGIQNGVDSIEQLTSATSAQVLGGTCRIISYLAEPGVIRHIGAAPTVFFGEPAGGHSPRTTELAKSLNLGSPVSSIASDDIQREIWRKFMFFAPVSGIGSVTRSPIGTFRTQPETRKLLVSAIEEVYRLGIACHVNLATDSVNDALGFIDSLPAEGTSSMQRDFEAGRRTELEALAGAVVRIGRRFGVRTPTHDFIYSSLVPLERKARGELT